LKKFYIIGGFYRTAAMRSFSMYTFNSCCRTWK